MSMLPRASSVARAVALLVPSALLVLFNATGCAGNDHHCSTYCKDLLSCATPATCVLSDPSGAQSACETVCENGYDALTSAEVTLVDACFSCLTAAVPEGTCPTTLPTDTCKTACDSAATDAAGKKWATASAATPPDPAGVCTNGRNLFSGNETCSGGGTGTTCTLDCKDGSTEVGTSCDGSGACTCTAGKNKGKTYTSASPCDGNDMWNKCNL
jgi:hypothetical protein